MLWQLRYRSPLAPTKGVDDVILETSGAEHDPAGARALADYWLTTAVSHPSTRFISLRPLVVCTEAAMRVALTPPAIPGPRVAGPESGARV